MIKYRNYKEKDIELIAPLYLGYFNLYEEATWTLEKVVKKLKQLFVREDVVGLIQFDNESIIGFAVGQNTQFDDGIIFELNEIFVTKEYQNKGLGSELLKKIEQEAKKSGAFRIQLVSIDDDSHNYFYNEKHGFGNAKNNVIKTKSL